VSLVKLDLDIQADLQRPCQSPVEICIYALHICKGYSLSEDHLVESADKEGIKETSVKNREPNHSADKLEVIKMLGVDPRMRIDLEGVIIVCGILEKTIERIKHFV